jgi:hypothetical protein
MDEYKVLKQSYLLIRKEFNNVDSITNLSLSIIEKIINKESIEKEITPTAVIENIIKITENNGCYKEELYNIRDVVIKASVRISILNLISEIDTIFRSIINKDEKMMKKVDKLFIIEKLKFKKTG